MSNFGEGSFGGGNFGVGSSSTIDTIDLVDFPTRRDDYYDWEPVFGDRNYDYGTNDDGYAIHPPCIICGVAGGNCTEDLHI